MRWLALAWCLLGCDGTASVDAGAADAGRIDAGRAPDDLDGFIEWHMAEGGIPGAALSIVKDGEIAWIGTYGYADLEAERAVDASTLFVVASISKTLTVTRVMQLVEEGRLDLDAPIETYVPYAVRNPNHPEVPITLRRLLTHTSSLDDTLVVLARASVEGDPTEPLTAFAESYVADAGNWSSAAPGARRDYCNAAFAVIGDAIERAGGEGFRPQTEREIFEVVDMDGAGWFLADVELERLAVPYGYNGHAFSALPHRGFSFYPASTLRVSIAGLSRFLLAIGGGGALGSARILEEASVDEMLRIQYPEVSRGQALSWSRRTVNGHTYVGHSGETYGGSALMLLSVEGTHGLIVLTNSDAYVRAEFGLNAGYDAIEAIVGRLDEEATR